MSICSCEVVQVLESASVQQIYHSPLAVLKYYQNLFGYPVDWIVIGPMDDAIHYLNDPVVQSPIKLILD